MFSEISDPFTTYQGIELNPFSDLYQELLIPDCISNFGIRSFWSICYLPSLKHAFQPGITDPFTAFQSLEF